MTLPRQIVPAATLMVSRRCFGRELRLRPSADANALFRYILAVAAERHQVLIHAYCVMSNHYHLVLTDPAGHLPRFSQILDSLVARTFNATQGRWESFWAPGSYSAVRLLSSKTIVEKIAYVLANPVAAGLVRHGRDWPGLWAAAGMTDTSVRVARPEGFFRKEGPLPEFATLTLSCPPGFESVEAFREQLVPLLERLELRAARRVAAAGKAFLGPRAVLAQKPNARPANPEPRRGLHPRVATRDKWKRIEALTRLHEFVQAHRHAWCEFAKGLRETIFPAGTYWMRVAHGVRCASF